MAAKKLKFKEEARQKILNGIKTLSSAVKITLGPKGKIVAIEQSYGSPKLTKDGVSVAKEIDLEDKYENIGAQVLKEVASKTADQAGDGTTTATVLAEALYIEGIRNITAGANPRKIKKGIDKAVKVVVAELKRISKPIQSNEEIAQVATVSSNGDEEIGKIIAKAMDKVGKDGTITVEEAKGFETTLDIVEGMAFDRGYLSAYFVTDTEKLEAQLEDAYILIYEDKISAIKEFLPVLQAVAETGKPLLIIAEDIEGEALATLVVNRLRAGLKICAVKAPGFGDRRKSMLEDIAILTGGEFINKDLGQKLENVTIEQLGRVKKAIIKKEETTLVDGAGSKKEINDRVSLIKRQINESTSDYDKEKLQERLAKLTGGVAVIQVGAPTEIELKEKKDRVDDAVHATQAAIEEGILPGGGTAFIRCKKPLFKLMQTLEGDERTGADIVYRSLSKPLYQIADNAGEEGSIIVQKVEEASTYEGYDVVEEKLVDMMKSGILDPTKVNRTAIILAGSFAGTLLNTDSIIVEKEDNNNSAMPQHPSPMDAGAGMY